MRPKPILVAVGLVLFVAGAAGAQRLQVGHVIEATFDSPHPYGGMTADAPVLVHSLEIHDPGATYVAPHFGRMELAPGDYVIVRSPDFSRSWRYEGNGKLDLGAAGNGGFWGIHITGERAIVELYAQGSRGAFGYTIDGYGRGFTPLGQALGSDPSESICTIDDKENAICYETSDPLIYEEGRAVARLLITGAFLCTGWLVGDEGHLMTNNHCIGSSNDALNTDYEFMAEGATCETVCGQLGCDGVIEATSATFIQTSFPLDFTLVQLPVNITPTYGFMQFRAEGALLDERIWSAQHPGGRGKEFAVVSTYPGNPTGFAQVDSLTEPVCQGGTDLEVGYFMDTEGGSSGSPVLGWIDNLVIALHHCRGNAFCTTGNPGTDDPNRGVAVAPIIATLGANLPNNAIGNSGLIFTDGFESGDVSAWDTSAGGG